MSMDDEDSKIRRNLVVTSAVILLAVWLRAPLDGMAEALFKVKPDPQTFRWRVWLAALLVLVYFGLRFRFSKQNLDAIKPLRTEYLRVERTVLRLWLSRKMKQFVRTGSAGLLKVDGLATLVEAQRRGIEQAQAQGESQGEFKLAHIRVAAAKRASSKYPPLPAPDLTYAEADLKFSFSSKNGLAGSQATVGLGLHQLSILRIRFNAFCWVILYSKGSTDVVLPWLLAAVALLAALYKVVRTW